MYRKQTDPVYYAFGYFAAAQRGEVEPLLSRKRVEEWVAARFSPEEMAAGIVYGIARKAYKILEGLTNGEEGGG